MVNDEDIIIMPMESSSNGAPYTTMLKELMETLTMSVTGPLVGAGPLVGDVELRNNLVTLLRNETKLQLMIQEDIIKSYKADKAQEELKTNNVTPLKPKK